jgi:outer membrane protein assembly factor BamB
MKTRCKVSSIIYAIVVFIFFGCSKPADSPDPQPTTPTAPTVTTSPISIISTTSAILGGSVSSDGGSNVTEKGVCYAATTNPTITNNKLALGIGTGNFSNAVIGLQPNTVYYVRAYAINSVGISYGTEQSFRTSAAPADSAVALYICGRDSLFAFNAQTGALKWKRFIGSDYIRSSPAYSNGKVFVAYKDKLFAFDTLGNTAWTGTTNSANTNAHQSPVIGNGLVYTCNETSRFIYAFNINTGNLAWVFDARESFLTTLTGGCDISLAGNTIIIANYFVYAIDAITGTLRWKTQGHSQILPLISKGKVYLIGDYKMTTLDSATGTILRLKQDFSLFAGPVSFNLANDRFFYTTGSYTAAFDTSINTNIIWRNTSVSSPFGNEEIISHSPMIVGNKLFGRRPNFGAAMMDAQTGITLWEGASAGTAVAIVNGIYYAHVKMNNSSGVEYHYIRAINIETNTELWLSNNKTLEPFLTSSPCVVTKSGKMHRFGMTYN